MSAEVRAQLAAGGSVSRVAKAVAKDLGLPRSPVYALALAQSREARGSADADDDAGSEGDEDGDGDGEEPAVAATKLPTDAPETAPAADAGDSRELVMPRRGVVRTLGVDFGLARVGLAVSSGFAPLPLTVVPHAPAPRNPRQRSVIDGGRDIHHVT